MTFEPFYPRAMRGAANHAESLCALLARLEPRPGDVAARAWLYGRRQEVECFVGQLDCDVRTRRLTEDAAASCLDTYLEALHRGLVAHFDEYSPSCCFAATRATVVTSGATDAMPADVHPPPGRFDRRDSTAFDEIQTDRLLAGLPTGSGR